MNEDLREIQKKIVEADNLVTELSHKLLKIRFEMAKKLSEEDE